MSELFEESVFTDNATLIDKMLNEISYDPLDDASYVPTQFALEFITFIKLVNGEKGEEHESPVMHYKMLDQIGGKIEIEKNVGSVFKIWFKYLFYNLSHCRSLGIKIKSFRPFHRGYFSC